MSNRNFSTLFGSLSCFHSSFARKKKSLFQQHAKAMMTSLLGVLLATLCLGEFSVCLRGVGFFGRGRAREFLMLRDTRRPGRRCFYGRPVRLSAARLPLFTISPATCFSFRSTAPDAFVLLLFLRRGRLLVIPPVPEFERFFFQRRQATPRSGRDHL